ncbi:MAG: hypothetical protein KDJ42_01025, partial [Alphaproteobacteria bacterium]|nr:hypothetical protein [Alphaproteobacteria bacterium]
MKKISMKKQPLSIKQREFLDFIKAHIDEHGYSPSWDALAENFNTGIPNVRRYITSLIDKGH